MRQYDKQNIYEYIGIDADFYNLSSIIAILMKRLSKDKCLKSFRNNNVNLEDIEECVQGHHAPESTFELEYQAG